MKIDRLDHLVLTVRDVEATCEFYSRVLHLQRIEFSAGRVALGFGQQKLNLHASDAPVSPHSLHPTPGSADLCFITTTPLDEVIAHLASVDVPLEGGPLQRTGATGPINSVYFRDPDSNLIEVSNYNVPPTNSLTTSVDHKHRRGLLVIAVFKIIKGVMLSLLAVGVLRLLHRDIQKMLEHWINFLRIDPDNRYAASLLSKAGLVTDRRIKELSIVTTLYAALFLTEGIGLWKEKRWAEWLSVIATASFLPLEVYEIFHHLTAVKVALLVANIAIIGYLVVILRRGGEKSEK